jgi:hypothetical protein
MTNLVGRYAEDRHGNITHFIVNLPKSQWKEEFVFNKSIFKVYGAMFNNQKIQVAHSDSTIEFRKYISTLKKNVKLTNFTNKFGDIDEMCEYGYEGDGVNTFKQIHFSECVVEFIVDAVEICLVPWHDGVMIQSILVPSSHRNNGLGTKIMNILYDISENTNIPLYLIPYPGERFEPILEKELVSKLENWYRELGFDRAAQSTNDVWPKVWSNME